MPNYIREYTDLHPKEQRQLYYKRRYKEDVPSWNDSMMMLRDLVADRVAADSIILDIGCGNGNFVIDETREKYNRVIGYDLDEKVTAKNITCDEVIIGDGITIPLPDGSADYVISLWVLEHLEEPEQFFCEIHRVLRPGGMFFFVTPNKKSFLIGLRRLLSQGLASKLVAELYGREEDDIFPVRYRANTKNDLSRFATRAGYEVVSVIENPDPSYTSFGPYSYAISKWYSRISTGLVKHHIIGEFKKI